ncbi:divalent-cation tolerance protein CutA [Candidatus Woesearchaeota archaeon]|nr:divalent-cation tolerance protein CutA [Candidatus Woesearchaeota archaeon]
MALVYITCRDKKEAKKISMHLLKKRLAACANIFPIKSMYWWKGKIVDENESAIIAKTIEKNFEKVVREVKRIHSYEIPCILRINAAANKEYEDWANKEIGIRTKKKGMNWTEQGLRAMLNRQSRD